MPKTVGRRDGLKAPFFLLPAFAFFVLFTFYPLVRTMWLGTQQSDPFGLRTEYVGLDQYKQVLQGDEFTNSLKVALQLVVMTVPFALVLGLLLALLANTQIRGIRFFRTVFSSTVATSVAVSSLLWFVLLHPSIGILNQFLQAIGRPPVDFLNNPDTALVAVSATTVWQNLGIVFVTMIAGLQSLPEEVLEAARVDGHGAISRFFRVTIPLLSPTLLFTTVVLTIRSFQTFGEVDLLTKGGPGERTNVIVYALFTKSRTDPGYAAALAVVLFGIVLLLTLVQFRFLERRVHYANQAA